MQFTCMSFATPSSRPASDMMILKVDPGASCAWMTLSNNGWWGSVTSLFHSLRETRTEKSLGSKVGRETRASTAPVWGIHRDDRSVAVAHGRLGSALKIQIDGQLKPLTRHRRFPAENAHFPAMAVDNNVLGAILAAQQLMVTVRQPDLPSTSPGS